MTAVAPLDPTVAEVRRKFHENTATSLAKAAGARCDQSNDPAERFAFFAEDDRLTVVAGQQERKDVERALARGIGLCGDRKLVLVLPASHAFATMQRVPWLRPNTQPEIWTYADGGKPKRQPHKTRAATLRAFEERLKSGATVASDLQLSTTAKHLRTRSTAVWDLVEWATQQPQLDPAHLQGERAWHCRGQKVLSIKTGGGGLRVTAGIHYTGDNAPKPAVVRDADGLTGANLDAVVATVQGGINERLKGKPPIHRPDEHWFQAVIRRQPHLVGVEQPALREFPSWRPQDDTARPWGRGFVDLLGVDGHADIRIVETKLSSNADELLILQGLDYYVWARAYEKPIKQRLAAARAARLEIHYVIGDSSGTVHVSHLAYAQAAALADDIPWRFQVIKGWFDRVPETTLLPIGEVPQ